MIEPRTYRPLMLCVTHSTSFHEDQTSGHVAYWGSFGRPCSIRMATLEEHQACGWGVADYPSAITLLPDRRTWHFSSVPVGHPSVTYINAITSCPQRSVRRCYPDEAAAWDDLMSYTPFNNTAMSVGRCAEDPCPRLVL